MITEQCNIPAADPNPKCACWGKKRLWFGKDDWQESMFADVPPLYTVGLKMKVCEANSRLVHMYAADNSLGLEFPILEPDSITPEKTYFVQRGFCYKCCKFEWTRHLVTKPSTPVCWIKCTKKRTQSRKKV
jgi:hypothetical protein